MSVKSAIDAMIKEVKKQHPRLTGERKRVGIAKKIPTVRREIGRTEELLRRFWSGRRETAAKERGPGRVSKRGAPVALESANAPAGLYQTATRRFTPILSKRKSGGVCLKKNAREVKRKNMPQKSTPLASIFTKPSTPGQIPTGGLKEAEKGRL